jgi:uncharacterized damage-inducible protein DinB
LELLQEFHRLFAYDAWANREVLATIKKCPQPTPRFVERMAHILAAERLWLERLKQEQQTQPVWPKFSLGQCESEIEEMARLWRLFLAGMTVEELEQRVSYKNTQGEPWSSQIGDILMHVVMHSVYHRGQIASDMRAAGFTPANTDFIHSVRRGFIE